MEDLSQEGLAPWTSASINRLAEFAEESSVFTAAKSVSENRPMQQISVGYEALYYPEEESGLVMII